MEYFLMILDVGGDINDSVKSGLSVSWQSVLIQLIATLILFLAVRFLFWNKITSVLEQKQKREKEAFAAVEAAEAEAKKIMIKTDFDREEALKEGLRIVERARREGHREAERIIRDAETEADLKMKAAEESIRKETLSAEEAIKKEIIETACLLTERMIGEKTGGKTGNKDVLAFIERDEGKKG